MLKKRVLFSPAGLKKKSFALPFNGGTIWYEHLDSLGHDDAAFREKLLNDLAEMSKPSAPSRLAVILDETELSTALGKLLVESLTKYAHPKKVAFVGASFSEKRQIKSLLQKENILFAVCFYSDLEKAKHWLIP